MTPKPLDSLHNNFNMENNFNGESNNNVIIKLEIIDRNLIEGESIGQLPQDEKRLIEVMNDTSVSLLNNSSVSSISRPCILARSCIGDSDAEGVFTQYDWAENLYLSLHRNDFIHRNEFIGSSLSPLSGKPDIRVLDICTSTTRVPAIHTSSASSSSSGGFLPSFPPVSSVLLTNTSNPTPPLSSPSMMNMNPPLSSPSMMSMKSACLSSLKEQTSVSTDAVRVDDTTSQYCDIKIENNELNDNGKRSREFVRGNDGKES